MRKINFIIFLMLSISLISCKKDNDAETSISILSMDPEKGSVISEDQAFSFEIKYYINKNDYEADALFVFHIYLMGNGSNSQANCGSTIINVPDSREGTETINGKFVLTYLYNRPYVVEINLYRYSNNDSHPLELAKKLIQYN
jgi:hypothetical protein